MSSYEKRERDILDCFNIDNVDNGYAGILSRIQARRDLLALHGGDALPARRDEEELSKPVDDEDEFQINLIESKVKKYEVPQIMSRSEQFQRDQKQLKKECLKNNSTRHIDTILRDQYDGRNIVDSNFTLEYIVCKDATEISAQIIRIVKQNHQKRVWILNDMMIDLTKAVREMNLEVSFTTRDTLTSTENGVYFCDVEVIRLIRNSLTVPHVIINTTCFLERVEFINRFLMSRLDDEDDDIQPRFINLGSSTSIDLLKEHIQD